MKVLNVWCSSVLFIAMAACAARPAATTIAAPPASRAALESKPVAWAERDRSIALVPRSIRRVQLVITPGWAAGQHYAWLISNGTEVIRVYRCAGTEIGEVVEAAVRTVYPTGSTPLDNLSFGVLGSIHTPPPPPPDPGGFPGDYVQQVMRTAWGMNHEQAQIDREAVGP